MVQSHEGRHSRPTGRTSWASPVAGGRRTLRKVHGTVQGGGRLGHVEGAVGESIAQARVKINSKTADNFAKYLLGSLVVALGARRLEGSNFDGKVAYILGASLRSIC